MDIFNLFIIITIPLGVFLLLYFKDKKKLDKLMKRENSKYSGHVNNMVDVFRIFLTVCKSKTISKPEKSLLVKNLVLTGVSWVIAIIWIVLLVFLDNW